MKIKTQYYGTDKLRSYRYYRDITSRYFVWQINENNSTWCFLDNMLTAHLIHAAQIKTALDLGSYLGMLPLFTEDILKTGESDNQLQTAWTLVDNFSFLNDLSKAINDSTYRTTEQALVAQIEPWKNLNIEWAKTLTPELLPPTNPNNLAKFHDTIISYYNSPRPKISGMLTDINEVSGKFDLIHFDLSASRYIVNKTILEKVVNLHLNNNGIIIFDDVKTATPAQLSLFFYAIQELNLYPVAFSQTKAACIKANDNEEKERLLINLKSRLVLSQDSISESYDWVLESTPEFGNYLKLRTSK